MQIKNYIEHHKLKSSFVTNQYPWPFESNLQTKVRNYFHSFPVSQRLNEPSTTEPLWKLLMFSNTKFLKTKWGQVLVSSLAMAY